MNKAYSFTKRMIYMNELNLLTFQQITFKTASLFMNKAYSFAYSFANKAYKANKAYSYFSSIF